MHCYSRTRRRSLHVSGLVYPVVHSSSPSQSFSSSGHPPCGSLQCGHVQLPAHASCCSTPKIHSNCISVPWRIFPSSLPLSAPYFRPAKRLLLIPYCSIGKYISDTVSNVMVWGISRGPSSSQTARFRNATTGSLFKLASSASLRKFHASHPHHRLHLCSRMSACIESDAMSDAMGSMSYGREEIKATEEQRRWHCFVRVSRDV